MTTGCNPVHILEHGDQNIIYKEDATMGSLISNVLFYLGLINLQWVYILNVSNIYVYISTYICGFIF